MRSKIATRIMTTEEGTSYLFNMLDQARTQMSLMANYLFDGYPLMGDSHSNFELQKREREKHNKNNTERYS